MRGSLAGTRAVRPHKFDFALALFGVGNIEVMLAYGTCTCDSCFDWQHRQHPISVDRDTVFQIALQTCSYDHIE